MAFFAGDARVFPFQVVSRQPVVKLFLRRFPMQEIEVCPVMLEMAPHAVLTIGVRHLNLGVIPMLGSEPLCHFLMTIETLKGRRAGTKLVAARALCGSRQGLMSFGKGTGRNLRLRGAWQKHCSKKKDDKPRHSA